MNQQKIGRFIARLRKANDLTQQELANRLIVSNKTISRWETGESLPDAVYFPAMAKLFGVTADELLAGEYAPAVPADTVAAPRGDSLEQALAQTRLFHLFSFIFNLAGLVLLAFGTVLPYHLRLFGGLFAIVIGFSITLFSYLAGLRPEEDPKPDYTGLQLADYQRRFIRLMQPPIVLTVCLIVGFISWYTQYWQGLKRYWFFAGQPNPVAPIYWLGLGLLLGLAAAWLARRVYLARRNLRPDKPFSKRTALALLIAALVSAGLLGLFMPKQTARLSDASQYHIVARDYTEYLAGRSVSNAPIEVNGNEHLIWLHNWQARGGWETVVQPGEPYQLIVDYDRVTGIDRAGVIYYRSPWQVIKYWQIYFFGLSLLLLAVRHIKRRQSA